MRDAFRHLAERITAAVGTPWAMLLAVGIVVLWAVSGPVFGFSDTWQLAINTGTTVVTFLMVFVIQASQNREARATQLKLDELIRVDQGRQQRADRPRGGIRRGRGAPPGALPGHRRRRGGEPIPTSWPTSACGTQADRTHVDAPTTPS